MNLLTAFQLAYNAGAGLTHEARLQAGIDAVLAESGRDKEPAEPWAEAQAHFNKGGRVQVRMSKECRVYLSDGAWMEYTGDTPNFGNTYWEWRIHPDDQPTEAPKGEGKPAWTLPTPPQGMAWHRTDFTEDMLPEGYRPLLLDEQIENCDEMKSGPQHWARCSVSSVSCLARRGYVPHRTKRPLPTPPLPQPEGKTEARSAGEVMTLPDPIRFSDTPLEAAMRTAFDNPSYANIQAVAQAAIAWEKRHAAQDVTPAFEASKQAAFIARAIFECGKEPHDTVQRIEFKGGFYPGNETSLGGLCLSALKGVIQDALLRWQNPEAQETKPEPRRITPDNSAC